MCCVVICAVCAACVLIYYAPSGCYDCCIRCIGAVPYPSLVATLLFYAGMALFCGCGHEALTQTEVLVETYFARNVQDFAVMASLWVTPQQILWLLPCTWFCCLTWRLPVTAPSIKYFQYVIYGLASFFFLYGILLLAEGFYATSAVKQTFGEFRSTQCGRCLSLTVRVGRSTGGGRLGWRQVIVKMLNACLFKPQWNVLCFSYFSSELWLIPGLKTPHSSHWNLSPEFLWPNALLSSLLQFIIVTYILAFIWLAVFAVTAIPVFFLFNMEQTCHNINILAETTPSINQHGWICMDARQYGALLL